MLEQLFGSRTRWKLMKIFLSHPDEKYYIRELVRLTREKINSIRRELKNLESWGIVKVVETEEELPRTTKSRTKKKSPQDKKYYQADKSFLLFNELKDLVMKSWLLVEKSLASKLTKLGSVRALFLCGRFVEDHDLGVDIFIVGSVNREKLKNLISKLSRSFGEEINYTVMTYNEYKTRKTVTDKFLYRILSSKHIKIVDRL